jgi:hypothetical protein
MRYALYFSIVAVISANTFAQGSPGAVPPDSKSSRDALIRSALARDHGEITAMEASPREGGGVFIGYSSGAVVNCQGKKFCRAFDGTPSSAVTGAVQGLSVSRSGSAEIVWVAYPHGVIYRCLDYVCREFDASTGRVE